MAKPIKIGLVLDGEDAEDFWEDFHNPHVTDEQVRAFKEALQIYKANPVH